MEERAGLLRRRDSLHRRYLAEDVDVELARHYLRDITITELADTSRLVRRPCRPLAEAVGFFGRSVFAISSAAFVHASHSSLGNRDEALVLVSA